MSGNSRKKQADSPEPEVIEVPQAELEGLSDLEQFLRVFSAPEQGKRLWDQWYAASNEVARGILDHLAKQSAEEGGISLEAARCRLAAEKFLNDRGPDYAVRYMESYRSRTFKESRALRPMTPRTKK